MAIEVMVKDEHEQWWRFQAVKCGMFSFHPPGGNAIQTGYSDNDYEVVDETCAHLYGCDGVITKGTRVFQSED